MTLEEAAAYLNVKPSKMRSMVFRKEIPYLKIGRLVRFEAQAIQAWLQSKVLPQSCSVVKLHPSIFEIGRTHSSAALDPKGTRHD